MKKILATLLTMVLLVGVMSTAVYAAPVTVGGTTTINAENFEAKTVEYYQDGFGKIWTNVQQYVRNRTLQTDGTMDYKIDFNAIYSAGDKDPYVALSGAYMTIDNIIKETTQQGSKKASGYYLTNTLYSNGPVTVKFTGGPNNEYGDLREITTTQDYRISKGALLYCNWNGSKQLFYVNEDSGNGATTTTQTLTEPGMYRLVLGSGLELQRVTVYLCILDSNDDMDSTINTEVTAIPSSAKVSVNGKALTVPAYNIAGNNYIKVRDIAYILNGTSKQFDIVYNQGTGNILLREGTAYTAVGGEMSKLASGNKTGRLSTQTFTSEVISNNLFPLAYNIENNNFVQLRDIGKILDFGVGYDGTSSTIIIDTSKTYDDLNK